MAITAADRTALPLVRRLEAAGFRAWPAASVTFDGSWQMRMTHGHPSRRLNCLVPLDPFDFADIEGRLRAAEKKFADEGLPFSIRQSPLCPPELIEHLSATGWHQGYETSVMVVDLAHVVAGEGIDHLPTQDIKRFAEACVLIDRARDTTPAVVADIITRIEPVTGLFLTENADGPVAVGICVHDHDLAGIQQVAVSGSARRQGLGRELMGSALRWARRRGARQAWLQVIQKNEAAVSLYRQLGFSEAYRYAYWKREPWT